MAYYYTKQGYALVAGKATSPHHFGGKPYHRGATCPVCDIPLLLLADLDCADLRKRENAKLFKELKRVPLYYCWRCCAEQLSYQIRGKSIKVFKNDGEPQGDDFPYEDFPEQFEVRPLELIPIPYETSRLLAVAQEVGKYWLHDNDLKEIQKGLEKLRHDKFSKNYFSHHQIGGLLNLIQGHEYIVCPNFDCKHHQYAKQGRGCRMSELAVIHNDPFSGLPMDEKLENSLASKDFNEFLQVVYWVCEECLTITTSNRCD